MKLSKGALCILVSSAACGINAFTTSHAGHRSLLRTAFVNDKLPNYYGVQALNSSPATDASTGETYEFQAEVGRVMDIIINSLYSDRDVFLRELVSNAADACDKKRFLSLTDETGLAEPKIKIKADKGAQTLTIEDSGLGMTKDELVNNLGKIASSGTAKFAEALGENKGGDAVNLIGQFGVGFYSGYLVAEKMTVITKSMKDDAKQYKWESTAGGTFTVSEDDVGEPIEGSGTRLIMKMKEDAGDYLETSKLEELLQRYSEFIEFPIEIYKETTTYEKVPDVEANKDLAEGEEPKTTTIPQTKEGYEVLNNQKPIWLRSPKEVTEEEYKEFYKTAFKAAYDEPMKHTHFVLEGQIMCKSVLYIPGTLPYELSRDMFDENARNIRLYVRRVFINDKFDELMPRWLKFVKGVVDSDDLPLNVGREILQKSKVLNIISKRLVRKSLDMIRDIEKSSKDGEYTQFWNNFGKYLKVGVIEDDRAKDDIAPLLRFFSTNDDDEYTSLRSYMSRMKEGQKEIYYVVGEGVRNTRMNPAVEKVKSKGYEVLLMTEPLDEICIQNLRSFKDLPIIDAGKDNLNFNDSKEETEDTKNEEESLKVKFSSVMEYLETELADKIQSVKVSTLLTESPAALVQGVYGMSPTMQRYMKAQSVAMGSSDAMPESMNQAILEINPKHPIVMQLNEMIKTDAGEETKNFATLLYDVAAMKSGYEIEEPADFASRILALMESKSGPSIPAPAASTPTADDESDDAPSAEVEVVTD